MNEEQNNEKAVTFKWGTKDVTISIKEIECFFEELVNLDIYNTKDLDFEFQEIADFTILGAPDNLEVATVKRKIKLLRLIYNSLYAAIQE